MTDRRGPAAGAIVVSRLFARRLCSVGARGSLALYRSTAVLRGRPLLLIASLIELYVWAQLWGAYSSAHIALERVARVARDTYERRCEEQTSRPEQTQQEERTAVETRCPCPSLSSYHPSTPLLSETERRQQSVVYREGFAGKAMRALAAATLSFAILLRIIIGFHPHSGQDDYQGPNVGRVSNRVKYGGDYEAQVHHLACI